MTSAPLASPKLIVALNFDVLFRSVDTGGKLTEAQNAIARMLGRARGEQPDVSVGLTESMSNEVVVGTEARRLTESETRAIRALIVDALTESGYDVDETEPTITYRARNIGDLFDYTRPVTTPDIVVRMVFNDPITVTTDDERAELREMMRAVTGFRVDFLESADPRRLQLVLRTSDTTFNTILTLKQEALEKMPHNEIDVLTVVAGTEGI